MESKVKLECSSKLKKYKVNKSALKNIIKMIVEELGIKENVSISFAILSKTEIQKLNKLYRKIDKPTNVLSFLIDYEEGKRLYGEILICPEVVLEQSKKLGNNFNDYFILLFIHGILHLLGYDHEKEEDRIIMEEKEEKLLNKILPNLKRQVIELCLR
jgi:probable rRNA maturation factor